MSRTRVAICVLAVSAGSIAAVAPARAAFPGRPGLIVFSSTFSGNRDIFTMSSDGSNRTDLTNDPHADITPSWSADGARIAFASDRSGTFEIYVMNADGSGVTQVTHDAAQDDRPRFTPDGRSLVYESTRGGNREIRRIGVDGAGEVDLTRSRAADRAPAVSPSGRLVAFTRGGHVWVMTIDGKRQHRVTSGRGTQDEPTWAPSGGRLAYVSRPFASDTSIRSILANGTGPRALAPLLGFDQANPVWSPDGRSIVYQRCSIGFLGDCTIQARPIGGAPLDLSPLRAPFADTFDGTDPGPFWQVIVFGTGASNTEQGGKLITTLAADSVQGGIYNQIETHWGTACRPTGDFDVQVDYRLLEWPAANGVQAALSSFAGVGNLPFTAIRESQAWGEQYSSWIPNAFVSQLTSDLAGTLRLQRIGTTAVVSYLRGGVWVPIASGPTSTDPASIALGASSSMNRFTHQEVKVAWDNFRINTGTLDCPTWWEDDSPDWQPLPG